jgi:hypothetical protein
MTADELKIFLAQEQFLAVDTLQANALISKHEVSDAKQEGLLTIAGTTIMTNFIFFL